MSKLPRNLVFSTKRRVFSRSLPFFSIFVLLFLLESYYPHLNGEPSTLWGWGGLHLSSSKSDLFSITDTPSLSPTIDWQEDCLVNYWSCRRVTKIDDTTASVMPLAVVCDTQHIPNGESKKREEKMCKTNREKKIRKKSSCKCQNDLQIFLSKWSFKYWLLVWV